MLFPDTDTKIITLGIGVASLAVKINKLCELLIQKGVITEEEHKNLVDDSKKEMMDAFDDMF